MEDLRDLLDRVDRLSKAIELATKLEDLLRPLSPRRSLTSTRSGDEIYNEAVKESGRLEDLLADRLRRVSERRNMVLSPIYRLDDDTWQGILLYACHSTSSATDRVNTSLRMSQVSREWRRVALDTAGLWTDRVLDFPRAIRLPYHGLRAPWPRDPIAAAPERIWDSEMIAALTTRSKDAPLERTVYLSPNDSRAHRLWSDFGTVKVLTACVFTVEDAIRLLEALPPSVDTFRRLEIQTSSAPPMGGELEASWDKFAELFSARVAKAQMLKLTNGIFAPLFADSRRCEGVLRSCRSLHVDTSVLTIPLLQNIIENSPILQQLELREEGHHGSDTSAVYQAPYARKLMPALEELDLNMSWPLLQLFLDSVTAPSLKSLSLSPTAVVDHLPAARHFLQSSPHVLHLKLMNITCNCCSTILASSPGVTSLTIGTAGWHEGLDIRGFSKLLMPSNDLADKTLCPNLETFNFGFLEISHRTLKSFLGFVRERASRHESDPLNSSPLRCLNMRRYDVPDNQREVMRELALLLGDGLSLQGWRLDPRAMRWHFAPDEDDSSFIWS